MPKVKKLVPCTRDTSPIIPQNKKLTTPLKIKTREKTKNQQEFLDILQNKDAKMIICAGPAGSSKTYLAVEGGLHSLSDRKTSEILYIRSVVESSDNKMGFLPGEKDDKYAPYVEPLEEKLVEFLEAEQIAMLKKQNRLLGIPIGFCRGLNWNVKYIIADEAQNMSFKEILTLITRVGEFSKIVICGDPDQSDIGNKSGFKQIFDAFNDEESKENGIFTYQFTEDDIVRSALVKFIVKKLNKK